MGRSDVSAILGKAFPLAFTPNNITARFRVAGIWPFNAEVFGDDEFLPAEMTNRPYPAAEADVQSPSGELARPNNLLQLEDVAPSTSVTPEPRTLVSPEQICPFPKAPPRKSAGRGRRHGRCMIATDTPEKQQIEEEKKDKPCPKKIAVKRAVQFPSSSSSDEELPEYDDSSTESRSSSEDSDSSDFFSCEKGELIYSEGSWVLAEFEVTGRTTGHIYYAGLGVEDTGQYVSLKFLRKQRTYFIFPNVDDISIVSRKSVVKVLPAPIIRVA